MPSVVRSSWLPLIVLLTISNLVRAQPCEPPARFLSAPSDFPFEAALRQLAEVFDLRLVTDPELIADRSLPPVRGCRTLEGWMEHLLSGMSLAYIVIESDTLIVFRSPNRETGAPPPVPERSYESEMLVVGRPGLPTRPSTPSRHYSHEPDLVIEREAIVSMGGLDLASALELASGVKLEQDRYMVIRGMKGRYQSVRMNGGVIPGLGPSHQSLPMDFFPVGIVSRVNLHKSVYADSPGGATAGLINIETLEIPENDFLGSTVGLGYREGTTGQPVVTSHDSGMNALGFRDNSRNLPASLNNSVRKGGVDALTSTERKAAGEAVPSLWGLYRGTAAEDWWLNLRGGKSWDIGDVSWGVAGALGLTNQWHSRELQAQRFQRVVTEETARIHPTQASSHQRLERQADQNMLLAAGMSVQDTQHLGANLIWLRQGLDYAELIDTTALDAQGEADDWQQLRSLFHWTELELRMQQLHGLHHFGGRDSPALSWQISYAETGFQRPYDVNYRYTRRGLNSYRMGLGFDQVGVAWRSMNEDSLNLSSQWVTPVSSIQFDGEFKLGCEHYTTDRRGSNLEFSFEGVGAISENRPLLEQPDPSMIFTPEHIVGNRKTPGFILVDRASNERQGRLYRAKRENQACFLLTNLNVGDYWTWVLGLRAERNAIRARLWSRGPVPTEELQKGKQLLPSLSAEYLFTPRQKLRASYSRTAVWPGVNELLPVDYEEIDTRVTVRGNPSLSASDADNLDVQWMYRDRQRLSMKALLYYKRIDNAIEGVFADSSEPGFLFNSFTFANADANSYGYELETDYELDLPGQQSLTLSGSYARIYSEVETAALNGSEEGGSRSLQGQPEYIAGVGVRYKRHDSGGELSLLFKRSGKELYIVSDTPGLPPVYQQPENQVSLAYNHPLSDNAHVTLAVDNVLESGRHYTQGEATYLYSQEGRTWRLSLALDI